MCQSYLACLTHVTLYVQHMTPYMSNDIYDTWPSTSLTSSISHI